AEAVRRDARGSLCGRGPGAAAAAHALPTQRRHSQSRDDGCRPGVDLRAAWKGAAGCAEAKQALISTKTAVLVFLSSGCSAPTHEPSRAGRHTVRNPSERVNAKGDSRIRDHNALVL